MPYSLMGDVNGLVPWNNKPFPNIDAYLWCPMGSLGHSDLKDYLNLQEACIHVWGRNDMVQKMHLIELSQSRNDLSNIITI